MRNIVIKDVVIACSYKQVLTTLGDLITRLLQHISHPSLQNQWWIRIQASLIHHNVILRHFILTLALVLKKTPNTLSSD